MANFTRPFHQCNQYPGLQRSSDTISFVENCYSKMPLKESMTVCCLIARQSGSSAGRYSMCNTVVTEDRIRTLLYRKSRTPALPRLTPAPRSWLVVRKVRCCVHSLNARHAHMSPRSMWHLPPALGICGQTSFISASTPHPF